MMDWQPIETAPKDVAVLLYRPDAYQWARIAVGQWNDDHFAKRPCPFWGMRPQDTTKRAARAWEPTHWMPLPNPPNEPDKESTL